MSNPARPAPFWSPAWRSRIGGHRQIKLVRGLATGALTLTVPPLAALLFAAPYTYVLEPALVRLGSGLADAVLESLALGMFLTVFAPIYGIVLVPVAMGVLALAMRFGCAGWGVAMLTACAVSLLLSGLVQLAGAEQGVTLIGLFITPVALLHALVLWAATRWLMPDTLLPVTE